MTAATVAPFIQAAADRRHAARAARWACASAIGLLAPLALLAWSDSLLVLSARWRWAALVLTVLALLGVGVSFVRACRRPSISEAARSLDEAASLHHSHAIFTSRELAGKTPADPVEGELLAHLHATAARLAAEARPVHPWPGLPTVFAALAAVAAFLTIAIREDGLAVLRALQPWLALPYTTIALRGPAEPPAKREPFAVTGAIAGRIPKELRLTWTGGRAATVPVNPAGSFRHALALGIQQAVTFAATAAADGHAAPLAVGLRRVPKVEAYQFAIVPPAYTGWPDAKQSRPGFAVLRGSAAVLTLQLDLPAKSVAFIPDNNQGTLAFAARGDDGTTWQLDLGKIARTFSYRIEITDEKATCQAEAEPQMIVALTDAPPKFETLTHNGDQLADAEAPGDFILQYEGMEPLGGQRGADGTGKFTLHYRATDDIGLAQVTISCESLTKEVLPREVTVLPAQSLAHPGTWSVALQSLRDAGIQPLDIVIVTVTALDNNTLDGPGVVAEPIFLEMPFPPSDDPDGSGGGGGGGGGPENVNPLALQKELHRQIVRASLGLNAPAKETLAESEQTIAGHLEKMAATPEAGIFGEAYVEHLGKARASALKAAETLKGNRPLRDTTTFPTSNIPRTRQPLGALGLSADTLSHLIEAAKIEAAVLKAATVVPGSPPPGTKYSLTKAPSKSDKSKGDQSQKDEQIEKAVADLAKLRRDQEQLDKEAAALDGEGKEGQQPGSPKAGQTPGQNPGQNPGPFSADGLAASQDALLPVTSDILKSIESLDKGDSQTDPKQAAEALRNARAWQEQVAAALRADNLRKARELGTKTEEALEVASLLTKALLDKAIRQSIEAQAPAPGYESLIQEYSRRISYD